MRWKTPMRLERWMLKTAVLAARCSSLPSSTPETDLKWAWSYQIKIYDLVGNLVQSALKPDFYHSGNSEALQSNGLVTSHIYWNCTNAKGMVVAAGVYRVVAYLHYWDMGSGHEAHTVPGR